MFAAARATQPVWSESDYLTASFESDMDFVDGLLEERNLGEIEHSNWQRALMAWFLLDRGFGMLIALPEVRVKVAATRYRVPDVCVFKQKPEGAIVTEPPLAIFEILSPEDRYGRLKERFRDYQRMGVRNLFAVENRDEFSQFREDRFEPIIDGRSALAGSDGFVDWLGVKALLL